MTDRSSSRVPHSVSRRPAAMVLLKIPLLSGGAEALRAIPGLFLSPMITNVDQGRFDHPVARNLALTDLFDDRRARYLCLDTDRDCCYRCVADDADTAQQDNSGQSWRQNAHGHFAGHGASPLSGLIWAADHPPH